MTEQHLRIAATRLAFYLSKFSAQDRLAILKRAMTALRSPPEIPAIPQTAGVEIPNRTTLEAIDELIRLSAQMFQVSYKDVMGRSRRANVAKARGLAQAAVRALYGDTLSYPTIGVIFNRDHSSVIHSVNLYGGSIELKTVMAVFKEQRSRDMALAGLPTAIRQEPIEPIEPYGLAEIQDYLSTR